MLLTTLRRYSAAAMSASTTSAPFSRAVVMAMQRLYPKALADNTWDNTGLLLEAPFVPSRRQSNTVLLTIDLTKAVAEEAIALNSSIVIAYHPIIFRGLKSLTFANTQQQTLLRLASQGISVYSPHTAVDAAPGGLGDWLADIVTGISTAQDESGSEGEDARHSEVECGGQRRDESDENPFFEKNNSAYTLNHHPSQTTLRLAKSPSKPPNMIPHTRNPIVPQSPAIPSHPGAGMGRIVHFNEPQPLPTLLDRIGKGLNNPKGFPIAIPQNKTISEINVSSIGICAGSGASLLGDLDVDLLFTGEMSHHEALAAIEKGQVVISLFHSNSERGFLVEVLRGQLEEAIDVEWQRLRDEEMEALANPTAYMAEDIRPALLDENFEVVVSEVDRDPYGIVVLKGEAE